MMLLEGSCRELYRKNEVQNVGADMRELSRSNIEELTPGDCADTHRAMAHNVAHKKKQKNSRSRSALMNTQSHFHAVRGGA